MKKKIFFLIIAFFALAVGGVLTYFYIDFSSGKQKVNNFYKEIRVKKILNMGATKTLEILPLVDWFTDRDDLKGEPGVSYLIKTDEALILFDVGLNEKNEDQSPLLHNMNKLGIDLNQVGVIVISHNHGDHVGGFKWSREQSFSLANHQIHLGDKRIYTPVPMTYPGLQPVSEDEPVTISKGVVTTGTMPSYLFFAGWTAEQSLAINVAGKGIVIIVGCGHQTIPRLIERTRLLFDEPIYGVVGGFHYPVTDSRIKVIGIPLQRVLATGKPPWRFITMEDVNRNIDTLKKIKPEIIALSPHDSCDASLDAFREAFPSTFRDIRVGKNIVISR